MPTQQQGMASKLEGSRMMLFAKARLLSAMMLAAALGCAPAADLDRAGPTIGAPMSETGPTVSSPEGRATAEPSQQQPSPQAEAASHAEQTAPASDALQTVASPDIQDPFAQSAGSTDPQAAVAADSRFKSPFARKALAIHRILCVKQLQYSSVQEALKLRDDQVQAVEALDTEGQQLFRKLLHSTSEDQAEQFLTEVVPAAERHDGLIKKTLDEQQQRQLRQIAYREQQDPGVFLLPDVVERLGISDGQFDGIEALVKHCDEQVFSAGFNPLKLIRLKKVLSTARSEAFNLLTDKQKQLWNGMQGNP